MPGPKKPAADQEAPSPPPAQPPPKGRGRPAKTLEDLPEGWQDAILDMMGDGASLQEVKADLNISNDQHARWMEPPTAAKEGETPEDTYGEYRETIKRGTELSEAWWLRKGRTNLSTRDFSAVLWHMNMQNRFGWSNRSDVKAQVQAKVKTATTTVANMEDLEELFESVEPPPKEVP